MRRFSNGLIALCAAAAGLLATGGSALAATATLKYQTGVHEITIPLDVSSLHVVAVGGTGGAGNSTVTTGQSGLPSVPGGGGAIVDADLPVVPGGTYYLVVGGNGANAPALAASGHFEAGGGGGASDIRTLAPPAPVGPPFSQYDTRLLVAAGGGGGGYWEGYPSNTRPVGSGQGGDAGQAGHDGQSGYLDPPQCGVNNGGCDLGPLEVAPGGDAGAPTGDSSGGCGTAGCGHSGTFGFGGGGGDSLGSDTVWSGGGFNGGGQPGFPDESVLLSNSNPGGGGGGGYYGGGGGGSSKAQLLSFQPLGTGGGGGGSNLVPAGGTVSIDRTASPSITISFTQNAAPHVTLDWQPSLSNDNTPTFTGTADTDLGVGSTVSVRIYNTAGAFVERVDTTANPTTGAYSVTFPQLPDGTYSAMASQSDVAGNTGYSSLTPAFTIDTTAPAVSLTGAARTTNTEPTLTGTAGRAPGDLPAVTVKLYNGSSASGTPLETVTATPDATTGAYSVIARHFTGVGGELALGTYTAVATQSDTASNVGRAQFTFTVSNPATTTSLTALPTTAVIPGITPVTMAATVNPLAASGSVQFWSANGNPASPSIVPVGAPVPLLAGVAARISTLPASTFKVWAQFIPTDTTLYDGSNSQNVTITLL